MLVTFDVSTSIGGLQKKKLHYGTSSSFLITGSFHFLDQSFAETND